MGLGGVGGERRGGSPGSSGVEECSHNTLITLGSAWHREVSGDCDVITATAFFRCGGTPLSPRPLPPTLTPSSPISLPIMHFRRTAFPLTCLFFHPPPPSPPQFSVTSSVNEVSPASRLRILQMVHSHLLSLSLFSFFSPSLSLSLSFPSLSHPFIGTVRAQAGTRAHCSVKPFGERWVF